MTNPLALLLLLVLAELVTLGALVWLCLTLAAFRRSVHAAIDRADAHRMTVNGALSRLASDLDHIRMALGPPAPPADAARDRPARLRRPQ